MNSHEVFIHIHQGCFAGTGAIVRLPQCQRSKPDGYGKISQCITTTKHSKAKTVCIFLGIYCNVGSGKGTPSGNKTFLSQGCARCMSPYGFSRSQCVSTPYNSWFIKISLTTLNDVIRSTGNHGETSKKTSCISIEHCASWWPSTGIRCWGICRHNDAKDRFAHRYCSDRSRVDINSLLNNQFLNLDAPKLVGNEWLY